MPIPTPCLSLWKIWKEKQPSIDRDARKALTESEASYALWPMCIMPALRRLKLENHLKFSPGIHSEFQTKLNYMARWYLKNTPKIIATTTKTLKNKIKTI